MNKLYKSILNELGMKNIEIYSENSKDLEKKIKGHPSIQIEVHKLELPGLNITGNNLEKEIPKEVLDRIYRDIKSVYQTSLCDIVSLSFSKALPGQIVYISKGYRIK